MPASPQEPKAGDESILKNYNEVLIRKIESKMLELERVNKALEAEIAAAKTDRGENIQRPSRKRTRF